MPLPLIESAAALAVERHKGQHRPNKARQPKIEHIAEVATLTEQAGGTPELIAAAWLHDIVEDTPTTLQEIQHLFGANVATFVSALTDPPHFEALPLAQRKARQAERLKQKSPEIFLVKLADQISNVHSVYTDPPLDWTPQTALEYIEGANLIADVCQGHSPLLDEKFAQAFALALTKYRTS